MINLAAPQAPASTQSLAAKGEKESFRGLSSAKIGLAVLIF